VAVVGTITPDPSVSSSARCGAGSVTLGASSAATLIWYATASGGTQLGTGTTFTTPFITTTTTYYVQATNGICPGNFIPVQAIINTPPTVSLGPDTIFVVTSTVLDAGSGFSAYSWSTTASTQTITVTNTGNYCVTVTGSNSCTATDCIYVNVDLGIRDEKNLSSVIIFPNPTDGIITVEYSAALSAVKQELFNSTGQLITGESLGAVLPGSRQTFSLHDQPNGIYFIRITYKDGVLTKFIVKN
ncbi:MAG TPA: T9SS type A sorting domain-containing protein, partial [Bacteroidia bacterium]|nr:T9SS type A sorting domain-containing protein [Bacteroidia bacterium]